MLSTFKATQGFARVKIKSVTDSLFLWGGILMATSLTTSWFAPLWITIVSVSFAGLFLIAGLSFYWYFAIKDPKFLRGEVFHQNMAMIENMGSKDQPIKAEQYNQLININNPDTENDATEENNEAQG